MRSIYAAVALLLTLTANAQTDSVRTEYKTEDESISKSEVKRFIRYITRANVEEKTLLKVGFWPSVDRSSAFENRILRLGTNLELSVEKKLTPALSVFIGVNGYLSYTTYKVFKAATSYPTGIDPQYVFNPERLAQIELNGKFGFRYYHNMVSRTRKGLTANNFSGNYLTIQVTEPFRGVYTGTYYNLHTQDRFSYRFSNSLLIQPQPQLSIAYGIQRRLGKWGYFDINAGPEILFTGGNSTRNSFQLNAIVGLGW